MVQLLLKDNRAFVLFYSSKGQMNSNFLNTENNMMTMTYTIIRYQKSEFKINAYHTTVTCENLYTTKHTGVAQAVTEVLMCERERRMEGH